MLVYMQFYLDKHRPRSDQEDEAGVVREESGLKRKDRQVEAEADLHHW